MRMIDSGNPVMTSAEAPGASVMAGAAGAVGVAGSGNPLPGLFGAPFLPPEPASRSSGTAASAFVGDGAAGAAEGAPPGRGGSPTARRVAKLAPSVLM